MFHGMDHSDVEVLREAIGDRHDLGVHCIPIQDRRLKLLKVLIMKVSLATFADCLKPMMYDVALGAPLLKLWNEAPPSISISEMEGLIFKAVKSLFKDGIMLICC